MRPLVTDTTLSQDQKKHFRAIGHALKPIVTVAEKGLTNNILVELDRALYDHELIKVKIAVLDREAKQELILSICEQARATLIQSIGKIALIYKRANKPNPKLSNILRHKP